MGPSLGFVTDVFFCRRAVETIMVCSIVRDCFTSSAIVRSKELRQVQVGIFLSVSMSYIVYICIYFYIHLYIQDDTDMYPSVCGIYTIYNSERFEPR